ncbi:MAG: hypothetical protein IJ345_01000 [Clostridia bacterium]|nr:hypothetical protein [Clostridia bacterium]
MKKLLALCLALLLCMSVFAACGTGNSGEDGTTDGNEQTTTKEDETTAGDSEETTVGDSEETTVGDSEETTVGDSEETTVGDSEETTASESAYDVNAAIEFLNSQYKGKDQTTPADYELYGQVMVGLDKYMVTWTVDSDKVNAVEGSPKWTIEVNEMSLETVNYKITATVTAPDGTTATVSYDRVVPKFEVTSFEDYMAATEGNVTVAGIVVGINAKSAGNTRNHLFLADVDGKGGYYCYQLDSDPLEAGVELGMTVAVTAPVSPYSGMQETKGGAFVIIDETIKDIPVFDITEKFAAGESLKNYVGLVVTIKGVTISNQELGGTSEYLNFELNGQKAYVRTYVTDFPTTLKAADKATIDAAHAANFGNTADATGILVLYSGKPYLIPTSTDCFSNYTVVTKTDAEKVEAELEELVVSGDITADTTLALPLVGQFYDDVKFAWTVDNAEYAIGEDGKVEIVLTANAVVLKFTVTATCGKVTETKEYTVNVAANFVMSTTRPYTPYINQVTAGKVLFLDGGVSGRYLTTTTDVANAVAVYAEQAEGGYKFYILVDGAKQYITIYNNADGKTSVNYDANGTTVFSYNPTVNAFTTNFGGNDVYLGTYNNFETISVSNLSYINAENTGVSQFPLELLAAAPGASYTGSLTQVNLENKVLYLDGGVSGRYLTTTENVANAVAVYAEKVDGGFKFYIIVEDAKQYITVYNNDEGKLSVKYDAAGTSVYEYDATVNAWVTVFENAEYYLGTYNTFNTISASKLSYISAENTGVSQFPLEYNN